MLNVAFILKIEKDVLGPGERVGIWFQGCSLNCKNCIAPELKPRKIVKLFKPEDLVKEIKKYNLFEITLSGGEPFEQDRESLLNFLKLLKNNNFGIWVYSGYYIEELISKGFEEHLRYIDVLVDGRYEDEKNFNQPLVGSSNQRIIFLSNKYKDSDLPRKRKFQIVLSKKRKFFFIGIPPKGIIK